MTQPADPSFDVDAYASAHLRTYGYDWYVAFQYAPAAKRQACIAVFAYLEEIARIRSLISDPMPGEIRLQWWRDALSGTAHGAVSANPLAAALLAAIDIHALPTQPLLAVLDGRAFDLYDDAPPTLGDVEGYAGEVWSGPMSLVAGLLSGQTPADFADIAGHGGVARHVALCLADVRLWSGKHQCFVATELMDKYGLDRAAFSAQQSSAAMTSTLRAFAEFGLDHLKKSAAAARHMPPSAGPAFLPLALTRKTLQAADQWASEPFAKPLATPKWRKLFQLWRASKQIPIF